MTTTETTDTSLQLNDECIFAAALCALPKMAQSVKNKCTLIVSQAVCGTTCATKRPVPTTSSE
jgi:hypothetical protein